MRTASNPTTKRLLAKLPTNPALRIDPHQLPDLSTVEVSGMTVVCGFEDGRMISFPLSWSRKLTEATAEQRQAFEFNAHFIFWDDIDEIIGVRNILFGNQLKWE
ncbi:DUF2442 domain-containing protein [Spirosoma fluviale]|uniref:DUF2442 domain-containing protein n=1 Tax=Spirosoma fluviale TaxID=1597977 RepID=A0A286FZ98_9BACT|nr:DUF2442 domain-containing protein [Spirosoma fluviale]SOD88591.1 Protein of unknown function [Spirosoma fluviale]